VRGKSLSWLLNALYTTKAIGQHGSVNFAGAEITYSPIFGKTPQAGATTGDEGSPLTGLVTPPGVIEPERLGISIQNFLIRGQPLDPGRTYQVAASGGIWLSLEFLKRLLPGAIPLDDARDTGLEDWRIMADYLHAHSPLTRDQIRFDRVRTSQPDLGVLHDDVSWQPGDVDADGSLHARIRVHVTNRGASPSPAGSASSGPRLELLVNDNGTDYALAPAYRDAGPAQAIPALGRDESVDLVWDDVRLAPSHQGLYSVTARVTGNDTESNRSNDEITRQF
jgi:hypothetical protein